MASNYNWLQIALIHYLKTQTYAANVDSLLDIHNFPKCVINLKIKYDLDSYKFKDEFSEELIDILTESDSCVEIEIMNEYWNINEAIKLTKKGVPRPTLIDEDLQPSGRGNKHNTSYIWHQKFTKPEDFEKLLEADHILREPVDMEKYKSSLFPKINGIYIIIGSTDDERLPRYLLGSAKRFVSAKGIPTEHSIQNPTGVGEVGYIPYIHFIVDVPEELNEGKRTISNTRLVGLINEFFTDAYRVTLRTVVTRITGRKKRQTRKIAKKEPPSRDIVDLPNISLPNLSIKKIPKDEETVLALFYELIGKGYLKGYQTYANFRIGEFDGKGLIIPTTGSGDRKIERDSDLDVFEFKKNLSEIIDDFDGEEKDPEKLDLLICWNEDIEALENDNYQMIYIEHSAFVDSPYFGVTKCLRINEIPVDIQVLVLSEVIQKIIEEEKKK